MESQVLLAGENWASYHLYSEEGLITRISFDEDASVHMNSNEFIHGRSIRFDLDDEHLHPTGQPTNEVNEKLIALQDKLLSFLERSKVDCRFVAIITPVGYKEFLYQVNDVATFEYVVTQWGESVKDYSVELIDRGDWNYFQSQVLPDAVHRQQIADQDLIERLVEAGSNPAKTHSLEHTFRGGPEQLNIIREELTAADFQLKKIENTELVVSRDSTLDLDEVFHITANLHLFAKDIGANYEGWGCQIVA